MLGDLFWYMLLRIEDWNGNEYWNWNLKLEIENLEMKIGTWKREKKFTPKWAIFFPFKSIPIFSVHE